MDEASLLNVTNLRACVRGGFQSPDCLFCYPFKNVYIFMQKSDMLVQTDEMDVDFHYHSESINASRCHVCVL